MEKKSSYIKLPNGLIRLAKDYKCLIPTYIYVALHSDSRVENVVDTNLEHIVETFKPNEDSRKGLDLKFKQCLKILQNDYDSIDFFYGSFGAENLDEIRKNERIQFTFVDASRKDFSGYVKLNFKDVYDLIDTVPYRNELREEKRASEGTKDDNRKIDLCDVLNVYAYYMYRKNLYEHNGGEFDESLKRIGKQLGLGDKTVARCLNEIGEILSGEEEDGFMDGI